MHDQDDDDEEQEKKKKDERSGKVDSSAMARERKFKT